MRVLGRSIVFMALVLCPPGFAQVGDFEFEASVGSDNGAGIASFSDGAYTIEASGADIWGGSDGMYWVYSPFESEGFRVTWEMDFGPSVIPQDGGEAENDWKKAGVMFRADESDGAINVMALIRTDNAARIQVRPEAGAATRGTPVDPRSESDTQVFQFVRIGETFSLFRQQEDGSFRNVGNDVAPEVPTSGFIGLALTSHDTNRVESANFSNVQIETISAAAQATRLVTGGPLADAGSTITVELGVAGIASDSDEITVTDEVPEGWTIDAGSFNATAGSASANGRIVTWTLTGADMAGDPYLVYEVTAGPDGGQQFFSGSASVGGESLGTGGAGGVYILGESDPFPSALYDGHMDISDPANPDNLGAEGTAIYDAETGTMDVFGSGNDIWGTADNFHYVYKAVPINEFVSIEAQVVLDNFTSTNTWAKAGPMIRDDLDASASHVFAMIRSQGRDFAPQWRPDFGAGGAWDGDPTLIFGGTEAGMQSGKVGVSRDPSTDPATITFWYYDAVTGERVDSMTRDDVVFLGSFDDPDIIYAGLAVTAHEVGSISIGTFTEVTLQIGDDVTDVVDWSLY